MKCYGHYNKNNTGCLYNCLLKVGCKLVFLNDNRKFNMRKQTNLCNFVKLWEDELNENTG